MHHPSFSCKFFFLFLDMVTFYDGFDCDISDLIFSQRICLCEFIFDEFVEVYCGVFRFIFFLGLTFVFGLFSFLTISLGLFRGFSIIFLAIFFGFFRVGTIFDSSILLFLLQILIFIIIIVLLIFLPLFLGLLRPFFIFLFTILLRFFI